MTIKKPSRNDPCPCGSGKKYKQCCLKREESLAPAKPPESEMITRILELALSHQQAGRYTEAEAIYQQVLQADPNNPDALHLLGLIADEKGEHEHAVELISKALVFAPDFVLAHLNLGSALQAQGRLAEAIESFQHALRLQPGLAEAHNNLGNAYKDQGRLAEAVESIQRAISIKPGFVEAHNNLGVALQKQGRLADAIQSYRRSIQLKPDYYKAHNNLGDALQREGKLVEAAECFRQALRVKPDFAEAHNNLGNALKDQGQLDEAVESFRQALKYKPDFAVAYSNLLFLMACQTSLDPHEYLATARRWEQTCLSEQERRQAHGRQFQHAPLAGRRLKVAYVSGDLRQHAVSYFVEQLFAQHDKARIELFAYSTHDQRDAVTERLQASIEHWVSVASMSDATIRDRIDADGIDVLIDLSGHTAYNRLAAFARRAAPVQVHYLGFFASTGLTEMDYWLGDEILAPAGMDDHFSEQIWRLPRVWVSYDGKDAPPVEWQPSPDGVVRVGSFNNLGKLTPATLALWARVLHALPEGKLLLKTKELADAGNRRRILEVMTGHGIAADRIELLPGTPWVDYMACHNRLDIALDPVGGHGGGTSTCDALWMGVPVIHLLGSHAGSRFAATMLNAIGHADWIVGLEEEYVESVVALARDVERRRALRSVQRERMAASPLCDARGLAASMENAYFEMYQRWLEKQNCQQADT